MTGFRAAFLFAAAGCTMCSSRNAAPAAHPAPADERVAPQFVPPRPETGYGGGNGKNPDDAVVVYASNEDDGIRLENEWLAHRFGKFRKRGTGLASANDRHFDVITVELPDETRQKIYFDITDFLGKN